MVMPSMWEQKEVRTTPRFLAYVTRCTMGKFTEMRARGRYRLDDEEELEFAFLIF